MFLITCVVSSFVFYVPFKISALYPYYVNFIDIGHAHVHNMCLPHVFANFSSRPRLFFQKSYHILCIRTFLRTYRNPHIYEFAAHFARKMQHSRTHFFGTLSSAF